MLDLKRIKELIGEPELCDQDAQVIRDALYNLAELALESWRLNNKT